MDSNVSLVGNLTKEPELKFTNAGLAYTRFSIAVTRGLAGEETTSYYDVVAFGNKNGNPGGLAENVAESFTKGSRVLVCGRMEIRQYEKKDGTPGQSVEIIAEEVGASARFNTVSINKRERLSNAASSRPAPTPEYESF
jgi:single-strand DNA-binding protein